MKIVTASNGKKTVKMSKKEWQAIGKTAGWMKKADYFNPWDDGVENEFSVKKSNINPHEAIYLATNLINDMIKIDKKYGGYSVEELKANKVLWGGDGEATNFSEKKREALVLSAPKDIKRLTDKWRKVKKLIAIFMKDLEPGKLKIDRFFDLLPKIYDVCFSEGLDDISDDMHNTYNNYINNKSTIWY
jgi:hypothetical protein